MGGWKEENYKSDRTLIQLQPGAQALILHQHPIKLNVTPPPDNTTWCRLNSDENNSLPRVKLQLPFHIQRCWFLSGCVDSILINMTSQFATVVGGGGSIWPFSCDCSSIMQSHTYTYTTTMMQMICRCAFTKRGTVVGRIGIPFVINHHELWILLW